MIIDINSAYIKTEKKKTNWLEKIDLIITTLKNYFKK
jgi:hypothetical protein